MKYVRIYNNKIRILSRSRYYLLGKVDLKHLISISSVFKMLQEGKWMIFFNRISSLKKCAHFERVKCRWYSEKSFFENLSDFI